MAVGLLMITFKKYCVPFTCYSSSCGVNVNRILLQSNYMPDIIFKRDAKNCNNMVTLYRSQINKWDNGCWVKKNKK